jgi:hypothetical protein
MAGTADFSAGGFRFIPAVFQYSGGVAAAPGYAIERVRFREPLPLREGFAHVERHIKEAGTVRHGETSPDALREKGSYVLDEMERRLAAFDLSWADTTATQVYTVHDLHPFLADEIVRRGAARSGLTWHYARPPVRELEYEMDCRGVTSEHVV